MEHYTPHPYADLFPMMIGDEFVSLVEDIRRKGQIEKIVIFKGQILDGRNRYKACQELGIEPQIKQFTGSDEQALEAVLSWNLERRHLTSSQKAAIAVEIEPLFAALEEQARQRQLSSLKQYQDDIPVPQKIAERNDPSERETRQKVAVVMGTNRQYISDSKKLKETAPEVHEAVKSGVLNIAQAKDVARLPESARQDVIETIKSVPQSQRYSTAKTAVQEAKKAIPADPFERWEQSEIDRMEQVKKGITVVANQKTDRNLIQWAENNNCYVRVDRYSDWGNPFLMPQDGDRDEVCDWFAEYFDHK